MGKVATFWVNDNPINMSKCSFVVWVGMPDTWSILNLNSCRSNWSMIELTHCLTFFQTNSPNAFFIRSHIQLSVSWRLVTSEHISTKLNIPENLIRNVSGQVAFEEEFPKVKLCSNYDVLLYSPITNCYAWTWTFYNTVYTWKFFSLNGWNHGCLSIVSRHRLDHFSIKSKADNLLQSNLSR